MIYFRFSSNSLFLFYETDDQSSINAMICFPVDDIDQQIANGPIMVPNDNETPRPQGLFPTETDNVLVSIDLFIFRFNGNVLGLRLWEANAYQVSLSLLLSF